MFIDTDLLRMGAAFTESAGTIAHRGASQFADAQPTSGIFGDFDDAHVFHASLADAHGTHVTTMQSFRTEFESLAERANSAAAIFIAGDEAGGSMITAAADSF